MRQECRERFPRRWLQRKPPVSDPDMHHGMSGSLTCGGGENVPGIPGACATRSFRILQEAHDQVIRKSKDHIYEKVQIDYVNSTVTRDMKTKLCGNLYEIAINTDLHEEKLFSGRAYRPTSLRIDLPKIGQTYRG